MEFWDDYDHDNPELTYILESVKTEDVENLITHEFSGCQCDNGCIPKTCSCLQRSGTHYSYVDKGQLSSYVINVTGNKPVYECNNNCKCKDVVCGNKLVQLGPRKGLQIFNVKEKGWGLRTTASIDKGNFICEYAGEIITQVEAHKRYTKYSYMQFEHNYIFCVNEHFGNRNKKTFIDPTFCGNIGRYINHSCQPNSVLVPVRVNDEIPKLCIFAEETISKNQEITFDYGDTGTNATKLCLCGSQNCRKYLPFDPTI